MSGIKTELFECKLILESFERIQELEASVAMVCSEVRFGADQWSGLNFIFDDSYSKY